MFAVEVYAAVRQFVFADGKSRREAARVFGLSRDTIAKMCRYSMPPGYTRQRPAEKRERTRAFTELVSHYLFKDRFGRPGKGNDKGKVEACLSG